MEESVDLDKEFGRCGGRAHTVRGRPKQKAEEKARMCRSIGYSFDLLGSRIRGNKKKMVRVSRWNRRFCVESVDQE